MKKGQKHLALKEPIQSVDQATKEHEQLMRAYIEARRNTEIKIKELLKGRRK